MTEMVLTRLRDFSCRVATFDEPAGSSLCRDPRTPASSPEEGGPKVGCPAGRDSPYRLDIESALAWLRRELMEMRSQDQALIRQLIDLHTGIQELKLELAEEEEGPEEEEEVEEEEDVSWDSGSEAGASSHYTSFSSCLSTRMSPAPVTSLPRRLCSRRNSVP